MNLYEFEGKQFFEKHNITTPKGVNILRKDMSEEKVKAAYESLGIQEVVVKAQVLSGKRGKNNGIRFCSTTEEVVEAVQALFNTEIRGQYVAAVRIEEKLDIAEEHYLSFTYDTNAKQPVLIYSAEGGVDIEDVSPEKIIKMYVDIRSLEVPHSIEIQNSKFKIPYAQELWHCFLENDCRVVEINPLVKTTDGKWIAADAKIAIDDDAFYRHEEWKELEPRTMMGRPATEREIAVQDIDKGEKYYQGTAGKYIEMDGDIALMLIGGGASIANMDALKDAGLEAANYTEYSGNPPREKVYKLTKLVLSKPGIRGLWMCGVVSNFTNVRDTFQGFADAMDEIKPTYPIVIRRAGPHDVEGFELMQECAKRNNLNMKLFGKDTPMGETAKVLADMINKKI